MVFTSPVHSSLLWHFTLSILWPKIVSNIFCGWIWMKVVTLSQMCGRWCQSYYASRTLKVQFLVLCFWLRFVVLQVIIFNVILQWSGILAAQLTIFMGSVNHDSWKWLVLCFQKSRRMWTKKNYMKLIEEKEESAIFFWEDGRS